MTSQQRLPRTLLALPLAGVLIGALTGGSIGGCRPSEPDRKAATPAPSPAQAPAPSPAPPPQAAAPEATPAPPAQDAPAPTSDAADGLSAAAGRPLRAAFLVVDGVYNTELMAPYDVFQHTAAHARPGLQVYTVSPTGGPVTTYEGIRITPQYGFRNAPPADVLVVPSSRGSLDADLRNAALLDWVRRTAGGARHVVSLCDGAFVLAQAGLLDGVPATTFPADYERFARTFPRVDLRINVSFVDAGKYLTSQGGARSYDVALHLVDKLYGTKVAEGIGKGLLVPWPPNPRTSVPYTVIPQPAAPAATPAL